MLNLFESPRTTSLLLAIFITVILAWCLIFFSKITTLYCYVEYANCSPEITAQLQILKGKRLVVSNLENDLRAHISSHSNLRLKTVKRELPGTVTIILEPQEIMFVLKVSDSEEYLLITDQGQTIEGQLRPEWQIFSVSQSFWTKLIESKNLPESTFKQLTELVDVIHMKTLPVTSLYIHDWQTLEITLDTGVVLLLNIDDSVTQLGKAQEILSQLPPETVAKTKEIDLRYKLPVLRETITRSRQQSQ